jgi:hypothetical protein
MKYELAEPQAQVDISGLHQKDFGLRINRIRAKECISCIIVMDESEKHKVVVDVRLYRSRRSNYSAVYCIMWIRTPHMSYHGIGESIGGGYDMESHSIGVAIDSLGIKLGKRIHEAGIDAAAQALLAIGNKVSGQRVFAVRTYG